MLLEKRGTALGGYAGSPFRQLLTARQVVSRSAVETIALDAVEIPRISERVSITVLPAGSGRKVRTIPSVPASRGRRAGGAGEIADPQNLARA